MVNPSQVMETVKETINTETISTNQLGTLEANNDKLHSLILPNAGPKGKNIINSMNNNIPTMFKLLVLILSLNCIPEMIFLMIFL